MSLDDRLRRAHKSQLDDVRQRVDVEGSRLSVTAGRPPAGGFLLAAAAAILLLGGAGLLVRNAVESNGPTVEIEAGTDPTTGDAADADSASVVSVPDADSNDAGQTASDPTNPDSVDTGPSDTEASPGPGKASTTSVAVTSPSEPETESETEPIALSSGVANEVCPSGSRAELESAALRYVGENRGWGRLFDLVDEQDGPHYYQAWEPGYPDPVTVELTLAEPVLATEIRLAQDPFTPVDGDIIIEAVGQQIAITLEGTEGWKRHIFDEPTTLDRFTIRRESVTSNIMEVLVCVAPAN